MRSAPLLALCVTAVACSHPPLPAPSPTEWTTAVVPDTTCRSPVASASRAVDRWAGAGLGLVLRCV